LVLIPHSSSDVREAVSRTITVNINTSYNTNSVTIKITLTVPDTTQHSRLYLITVADGEVGECVDPEGNGVTMGRGAEGGAWPT
jgi:hypothetical protein